MSCYALPSSNAFGDEIDTAIIEIKDGIEALSVALAEGQPLPQKDLVCLRQSIQDAHVWLNELTRELFTLAEQHPIETLSERQHTA